MLSIGRTETRIHELLTERKKLIAALIDPEEFTPEKAGETAKLAEEAGASLIMVGGSTVTDQAQLDAVVRVIKSHVTSPVLLFPGGVTGVSSHADAILFMSLLNSNNPYFIIGAQAVGSMAVLKARLETIPMGYVIFGNSSAASFMGQVNGIPPSKPELAVPYAMASKYMGMRAFYLESGSGAAETVPLKGVGAVRKYYDGILFVGGGITSPDKAKMLAAAGADILVIGNLLETPNFDKTLREITQATK